MQSFKEQYGPWALISGASAGIGAEFARQLAAKGLNLILVARREARLAQLAEELQRAHGVQVEVAAVDLARSNFMERLTPVLATREIGLLINNAGFGTSGAFLDSPLEREIELLDVNCRASLILAHELGRRMAVRQRGGVIFVSSVSAYIPTPYEGHYAASKVYGLFLGQALWFELKQRGIDVLSLCPGETLTEFHEVAGTQAFGAMAPAPVVALALRKLGNTPSTVSGWHNRGMVLLTRVLPQRWLTLLAGKLLQRRQASLAVTPHR